MKPAEFWIKKLQLEKHPEGGWFKETYRSDERFSTNELPERYVSSRCFSTTIFYLLKENDRSVFHRLQSDETWHFYTGTSSILLSIITPAGELIQRTMGSNPDYNEIFQLLIPKGYWFGAELTNKEGYSMIGCTVAPGFEFEDFEMGKRNELINMFPQHQKVIERLTNK